MSSALTLNANRTGAEAGTLGPSAAAAEAARAAIRRWDGYAPTALLRCAGLAAQCRVRSVDLKLESGRFGTDSFKALGPPFALEAAMARSGAPVTVAVAATSGNHGRALAWGAKRLGIDCIIVMPAHTSAGREAAIRRLGAEVVRVGGTFEDALAAAERIGHQPGHLLIADQAGSDGPAVALDILAGYSVLADEIATAMAAAPPTHVFVAAGNGSLAAATVHRFANGAAPPKIISVEPRRSDAVRQSIAAGTPATIAPGASVMDGLVTGSPSRIAWPILRAGLTASLAIEDENAVDALRRLAAGAWGDPALEVGETGVAAVAGLVAASTSEPFRSQLGITGDSRLVAIVCEGVTDREVFDHLVGRPAPPPAPEISSFSTQGMHYESQN